ncbi:LOW QUALITY PROTEIN: hypothetical protein JCM19037_1991 [Geomicrobium sp. JCM 19037]|nr:LOW QUALITY PROTEIN: hypothetical protein JCM19037_1991 [Geomicrobium sp. JCM 19037]
MTLQFGGTDALIILSAYAVLMIVIGWLAGRGKKLGKSVGDYYLAGRNLGFITLFFTLYATQYSGNTIVGYAPTAYREGFSWIQSVPFMTAIIGVYLIFAPRLYVIAKRAKFVTPTDWISYRFESKKVTIVAILLMLWGLGNYLLEQLVAVGHAVSGLTGGAIPYGYAVIGFILVMLIYEWLGGMRAVALTDVLQGIILLVGIIVVLIGAMTLAGGSLGNISQSIAATEPQKIGVPDLQTNINWISMILLAGIGAAVYPHAVQRIYSARSERTLKRSFARMAWIPPITTGLVLVVGIICIVLYPGMETGESEQVIGVLANDIASMNAFYYWMMIIFFGGIVGAIVSTADSVLLSFSSMVSHDIYGKYINPNASDERKVKVGKFVGVIVVFLLLWIAWNPPGTLYQIFVLKFELLIQVAPCFLLGIYWKRLRSTPVFWGMSVGAAIAGLMTLTGNNTLYGIHGGIVGLAANFAICIIGSLLIPVSDSYRTKIKNKTSLENNGVNM